MERAHCLAYGELSSCSIPTGQKGKGDSVGLVYGSTDPRHEGPTLMTKCSPRSPSLNIITLEVRISMYEFGGHMNIQSIAVTILKSL